MRLVNRHVLIICPRQPMIDWVNKLTPDAEQIKIPAPFDHDQASVYLIPEFEDVDDFLDWFNEAYAEFFEDELFEWSEDESLFPPNPTFETFNEWFTFSYQGLVLDASSEIPLEHVEEDDLFDSDHDEDNNLGFFNFDDSEGDGSESDDDDDDDDFSRPRK